MRESGTHSPKRDSTCLEVLMETLGLLEVGSFNAGKRESLSKRLDFVPQSLDLLVADLALLGSCGNTHKVLKELGASLLLQDERGLNSTVQELGNLLNVLLAHVAGSQSRGTKTDTARDLGGGVTGNSVL